MLASSFLISFLLNSLSLEFLFVFFKVSISLVKYLFCSLFSELAKFPVWIFSHLTEYLQNCNLEFSAIYVPYFHVIVCFLEIKKIFFDLPCYLCYSGIWWIPSLSRQQYVSGTSVVDWYKEDLFFSNRWCWITRGVFLLCEIPMLTHCLWLPSV